ncbi:hypothetical protein QSV34_02800 [Porticoccus sp. W117]|uniref:hypothetical protein n=1 Tax=Porticoccus sp. W117 TaxID=3054777 RepID=UPI002599F710|nr:hypothetical protein [Porticoccus sp. W117]MDM3870280.1 hypothetical protein [Porticoccus sp. W117]
MLRNTSLPLIDSSPVESYIERLLASVLSAVLIIIVLLLLAFAHWPGLTTTAYASELFSDLGTLKQEMTLFHSERGYWPSEKDLPESLITQIEEHNSFGIFADLSEQGDVTLSFDQDSLDYSGHQLIFGPLHNDVSHFRRWNCSQPSTDTAMNAKALYKFRFLCHPLKTPEDNK